MLHSLLLTSLRGLDAKELSKPIDSVTFRRVYREMRVSERRILDIDAEFFDVQQQLSHAQ